MSACWVIPPWWMKPGPIAWFESKLIWPPRRWLSTLFDAENRIGNRCFVASLIDSRPENFRADRAFRRHCHMPRYVTKAASTLRRKAFRRLCHLATHPIHNKRLDPLQFVRSNSAYDVESKRDSPASSFKSFVVNLGLIRPASPGLPARERRTYPARPICIVKQDAKK